MAEDSFKAWERSRDTEMIDYLKNEMMKDFRTAVKCLKREDREAAQYLYGHGSARKTILEEKFDFYPEQQIDELDGLLAILEDEL